MEKVIIVVIITIFGMIIMNTVIFSSGQGSWQNESQNDNAHFDPMLSRYQKDSLAFAMKEEKTNAMLTLAESGELSVEAIAEINRLYPDSLCKCK